MLFLSVLKGSGLPKLNTSAVQYLPLFWPDLFPFSPPKHSHVAYSNPSITLFSRRSFSVFFTCWVCCGVFFFFFFVGCFLLVYFDPCSAAVFPPHLGSDTGFFPLFATFPTPPPFKYCISGPRARRNSLPFPFPEVID